MAVADDLRKLAAEDVVYFTKTYATTGARPPTEVLRGRVRQAVNGEWIFVASVGVNGVVGVVLGTVSETWGSFESPVQGLNVTISTQLVAPFVQAPNGLTELITLTTLIPADFAD